MQTNDRLSRIPEALAKTGFLVEHEVAETFAKAGWGVIPNRYYVDDVDGKTRELDLVLYRVAELEEFDVITAVLAECKKDAKCSWAFLTRDRPKFDPNHDWEPVQYWTSHEVLSAYLTATTWKSNYIEGSKLGDSIFAVGRQVFATQLVNSDGTSPQNDRPIFDAIATLLKGLDHELSTIPSRMQDKPRPRIYLLNLLTVVDAEMLEVQYRGLSGSAKQVESLVHLARFMVRKRAISARIHFVSRNLLRRVIQDYEALAKYDAAYFAEMSVKSYQAIVDVPAVREVLARLLSPRINAYLNRSLALRGQERLTGDIELHYRVKDKTLLVGLPTTSELASSLQGNSAARAIVASALRDLAKYQGSFEIDMAIPF